MANITKINYLFEEAKKRIENNDVIAALLAMRNIEENIIDSFDVVFPNDFNRCDKINYLFEEGYIDYYESQVLHEARMRGNDVVHRFECNISNKDIQRLFNELKKVYISDNYRHGIDVMYEEKEDINNIKETSNIPTIILVIIVLSLLITFLIKYIG